MVEALQQAKFKISERGDARFKKFLPKCIFEKGERKLPKTKRSIQTPKRIDGSET